MEAKHIQNSAAGDRLREGTKKMGGGEKNFRVYMQD